MTRVLVTGGSSLPGYRIAEALAQRGYEVIATYNRNPVSFDREVRVVRLDLTDPEMVARLLSELKPDIVVHVAAYSDVDGCEVNRELAWRVNVEGTRTLVKASRKAGVEKLVYISTDYVFDGERGGYREDDTPNPVNYYGLTKLLGEEAVAGYESYIIARTSAIYGFGPGRPNFGRLLPEKLSKGEEVPAFIDQRLSPTHARLLAEAVVGLIEKNAEGVYHVAGQAMTRYEFARLVARKLGFDESLVKPACMCRYSFRAKRPRDSSLDITRASRLLGFDFYSVEKALEILRREWLEHLESQGASRA